MLGGGVFLGGCAGSESMSNQYARQAGQQVAVSLSETAAPFGFHQYLPPAYRTDRSRAFPLLVFLHGKDERGDGKTLLPRVLQHGPPRVIRANEWLSSRPFIVLSPQLDTTRGAWPVEKVDAFINHAVETYRVDTARIYLTGLSLGGHGTWTYAAAHSDRLAAIAPVCGEGTLIKEQGNSYCALSSLPLWTFHGGDDPWGRRSSGEPKALHGSDPSGKSMYAAPRPGGTTHALPRGGTRLLEPRLRRQWA